MRRPFLFAFLITLACGCSRQDAAPSITGSDLSVNWELTLPAGFKRPSSIIHLESSRCRIYKVGLLSGVSELRDDKFVAVEPDEASLTEFVWQLQDPDTLVLVKSPSSAKTGADYTGARLKRLK